MKIYNLSEFVRGWFLGAFEPSVLKTKDFEVGILTHTKGEYWPRHTHNQADEINVLLSGEMIVNGLTIYPNDIFVIEKGEAAKPEFLTDCRILVIKVPSVPGDKHIHEE